MIKYFTRFAKGQLTLGMSFMTLSELNKFLVLQSQVMLVKFFLHSSRYSSYKASRWDAKSLSDASFAGRVVTWPRPKPPAKTCANLEI